MLSMVVFFLELTSVQNNYNLRNFAILKTLPLNTNEFPSSIRLPTQRRPATSH
ncbi:MAG: hypothetical protein ACI9WT_001192 [Flavobacterium sp.]|jgi:hypothetical protein